MSSLELRQYKYDSTQSKKFLFWNVHPFSSPVWLVKKRGNFKTGMFLTELSCSYIVLSLISRQLIDFYASITYGNINWFTLDYNAEKIFC